MFSPALVINCLFDDSHPSDCKGLFYWDSNLHFPDYLTPIFKFSKLKYKLNSKIHQSEMYFLINIYMGMQLRHHHSHKY